MTMKKSLVSILCVFVFVGAAMAQSRFVPIVDLPVGGLIGGSLGGKWVDAVTAAKRVKKGDVFNWYLLNGTLISGVAMKEVEIAEPCEDFYAATFETASMGLDYGDRPEGIALGSALNWNPTPRDPVALSDSAAKATYSKVVTAILRKNGLLKTVPKNIRAWRIDLDGDGVEEVILQSQTWGESIQPQAKAGNYSIIVLRKIVAGKVVDQLIASDFVKKNVEFGAPSRYKLSSIADLNGDGKMEFIIFGEYYEGGGSQAWEMKGSKAVEIKELQAACGV